MNLNLVDASGDGRPSSLVFLILRFSSCVSDLAFQFLCSRFLCIVSCDGLLKFDGKGMNSKEENGVGLANEMDRCRHQE